LWIDHSEVLRNITLRQEQLPRPLSLSSFIEKPGQANKDVVRAYIKGKEASSLAKLLLILVM